MKLTDVKCKTAKAKEKPYKLPDGNGLYLYVTGTGVKSWRYNYRIHGKEKTYTLGKYPQITLVEARDTHKQLHKKVTQGFDPMLEKKHAKIVGGENAANTFEAIAREWHEHKQSEWTDKYSFTIINRLEVDVFPLIGSLPISDITPPVLLGLYRSIETRGVYEVTRRINQYCSQIFRYAVITGRTERDLTRDIQGALKNKKTEHHAAIEIKDLPDLICSLQRNEARMYKPTRLAVELMMLTFVRTSELINMRWDEIEWDNKRWVIPAERMKMNRAHIVPLSKQALQILEELKGYNGHREWVFASHTQPRKPMSNNTILAALYRMGYKGKMTGHGFRALALTALQERLNYPFEIADLQLAHAKKNSLGEAYDRAQFIEQRTKMMQDWGNYLDKLGLEVGHE